METVGPPPIDGELNLLTQWGDPSSGARTRKAGILSVSLHVAVIVVFPCATLVARPLAAIVATVVADELHVAVAVRSPVLLSV